MRVQLRKDYSGRKKGAKKKADGLINQVSQERKKFLVSNKAVSQKDVVVSWRIEEK